MTFEEAIAALGTTPEQVTDKLREMGIKGYRSRAGSCPIAKYLNACGFHMVTVCNSARRYEGKHIGVSVYHFQCHASETILLPPAIKNWIFDFDNDHYPEFELT